jgi:hypothetical protein
MSVLIRQDQGAIVLAQQDYIPLLVESFLIDRRAQTVAAATISFCQKKSRCFLGSVRPRPSRRSRSSHLT